MTKPKSKLQQVGNIGKKYLPTSAVALRYDASPSTIMRWVASPELQFPQPIRVVPYRPNLFDVAELDAYDARRAEQERMLREERAALAAKRRAQHENEEAEAIEAARKAVQRPRRKRVNQLAEAST